MWARKQLCTEPRDRHGVMVRDSQAKLNLGAALSELRYMGAGGTNDNFLFLRMTSPEYLKWALQFGRQ